VSTGIDEGSVAASVEKTLAVHPSLEVATTQDAIRTSISKALVVTSEMKELLVQLAPALMGVISMPPLTSGSVPATIVETVLMNTPAKPTPIMDILKDLILHMIDQFFSTMTYYTELLLSGVSLLSSCSHYLRITLRTSEKSRVLIKLRCVRCVISKVPA